MTTTTIPSGGCIRLYTAYNEDHEPIPDPQWHINAAHQTIGLIDTSVPPTIDSAGYLVVKLTGDPNTRAVVYMDASPDETLVSRDINAGCSNGGPICRIKMRKIGVRDLNLNIAADWALASGTYANLWLDLLHVPV